MIDAIRPYLLLIKIAAAIALVAGVALWWSSHNEAQQQIGYDRAMSEVASAQAQAAEKQRLGEIADQNSINQEAKHAQEQIKALERQRDIARADADRMRGIYRQAAERGRQAISCAAGTSQGQPDTDPIGVFAELLARADRRAEIVADYADRIRIAAIACERSYDAIAIVE